MGGSLLSLPEFIVRVFQLLDQFNIQRPLLVIGGGAAADLVREHQTQLQFDDVTAHWMAIDAMSENARRVQQLHPRLTVVSTRTDASYAWQSGLIPLLDPARFLRAEEQPLMQAQGICAALPPWQVRLPAAWSVTSDSISAWVAARWPAGQLWLLKSCEAPTLALCELAISDRIDQAFPKMLPENVEWHWVNLRRATLGRAV